MGIREFSVLFMACTATAGQAQIRRDILDQGQRAFHQEHYTEARELYAQACQTVLDQGGPQLTECLLLLGTAANSMGDLGQALSLYTRARALCKDDSATCAWLLYDLAGVYQYLERFPEAEQTARQALLASTVAPGKSHPDKMLSIMRLGRILVDAGKLEEAEPLLRGAVAAVRQGGLPADIVLAQGQLGALLVARRQFAEAAALLRDNLQQVSAQFGADHAKTADALLKLGALYRLEGDWARAQPLVRRASYLYEKRFGPDCLELASALREEGYIALGAGETSISQRLFKRALDVLRISLPPDSPDVLALRHSLAQTYLAQGKYQHAETLLSD